MTGKKKRRPEPLGDVMKDVLRSKVGDRITQARVFSDWRALVGSQIADVTEPLSVTPQGTLFVAVKTNAWMNELSLLEPVLLKRLNEKTGRLPIRKIRWQISRG